MTGLFERYLEFMEDAELSMDRVIGTQSRGKEICNSDEFQKFWKGVRNQPGMRWQWESRLTDYGNSRERDAILKVVMRLATRQLNMREAA